MKQYFTRNHIAALATAAGRLLPPLLSGICISASACEVKLPRQGLLGTDIFIDKKNDGYLIVNYKDLRFDDMSEVYRLRDCARIASGTTAKSNFSGLMQQNGFASQGSIQSNQQRKFENAYYGEIFIKADTEAVEVTLHETSQDSLQRIEHVKKMVRLEVPLNLQTILPIADDPLLDRIPKDELASRSNVQLPHEVLVQQFFALHSVLQQTNSNKLGSILRTNYADALAHTAHNSIQDVRFVNLMNDTFEQLVNTTPPPELSRIEAWLTQTKAVGLESTNMIQTMVALLQRDLSFADSVRVAAAAFAYSPKSHDSELGTTISASINHRYEALIASTNFTDAELATDGAIRLSGVDCLDDSTVKIFKQVVRSHGAFSHVLTFYNATQNLAVLDSMQDFAKSNEDHLALERIAVALLKSPGRLFDLGGAFEMTEALGSKQQNMGVFANWTATVTQPLRGYIQIKPKATAPLHLRFGTYKVTMKVSWKAKGKKILRSGILGNNDEDAPFSGWRQIEAHLSAPDYQARIPFDLGSPSFGYVQSGSQGGFTLIMMQDDPVAIVEVSSISPIN